MNLRCPDCGGSSSLVGWANESSIQEAFVELSKVPSPVNGHVPNYLSLFRPKKTSLTWKRTLKLIEEIKFLVLNNCVSVGSASKACSPEIWAEAMETMINQRDELEIPFKNHNYLKSIAFRLAGKNKKSHKDQEYDAAFDEFKVDD
jgi:hypothetical protein